MTKNELTPAKQQNCIQILKERFEKNMHDIKIWIG